MKPPTVTVTEGMEQEIALLREWKELRLTSHQLADRLEALRLQALQKAARIPMVEP